MRLSAKAGIVTTAAVALLSVAGPALADDCVNVSRNPNPTPAATTVVAPDGTVIQEQGGWVNVGGIWLKITPGTDLSQLLNMPGSNGNYQNTAVTGNDALLQNSAYCKSGGTATSRPIDHGIQTGCGA